MNDKRNEEYDITKSMMNKIRVINEACTSEKVRKAKKIIKEEENKDKGDDGKKEESIAITNDPKFGQNALQNQIDAFKQAVNGGAKFADENSSKPDSNPLVYFPKTGNLVFSGSIPNMSDLKFQFSLNDVTNAPYIFVDGLALTEDVITTLNKIHGFYLNWKEEWQTASDLLDRLGKDNED